MCQCKHDEIFRTTRRFLLWELFFLPFLAFEGMSVVLALGLSLGWLGAFAVLAGSTKKIDLARLWRATLPALIAPRARRQCATHRHRDRFWQRPPGHSFASHLAWALVMHGCMCSTMMQRYTVPGGGLAGPTTRKACAAMPSFQS